jgi:hypothetical protein
MVLPIDDGPDHWHTGRMTTMQTRSPLKRLAANSGQEPVTQIVKLPLDLNPPYQRGSVWGLTRRRNLIRSLMLGIPTGNVFLNVRRDERMTTAVVDGKQRIETCIAFFAGEFSVPASWFPADDLAETEATDDGPYVRYTGLTERGQRYFDRASMTTQRTDLRTIAQEAALFDLVNYGGVPQGERDEDAA